MQSFISIRNVNFNLLYSIPKVEKKEIEKNKNILQLAEIESDESDLDLQDLTDFLASDVVI